MKTLSLIRIFKLLEDFGFSRNEAEVYVYLAKTGPSGANDLTLSLSLTLAQLSEIITNLQERRAITIEADSSIRYAALSFEKLLDQQRRLNLSQAELIKTTKQELSDSWEKLTQKNSATKRN